MAEIINSEIIKLSYVSSYADGETRDTHVLGHATAKLYSNVIKLEVSGGNVSGFTAEIFKYKYNTDSNGNISGDNKVTAVLVKPDDSYTNYISSFGDDLDKAALGNYVTACTIGPSIADADCAAYHVIAEFSDVELYDGNTYYLVYMPTYEGVGLCYLGTTSKGNVDFTCYHVNNISLFAEVVPPGEPTIPLEFDIIYDAGENCYFEEDGSRTYTVTKYLGVPLVITDRIPKSNFRMPNAEYEVYYDERNGAAGDCTSAIVTSNNVEVFSGWTNGLTGDQHMYFSPGSEFTADMDITLYAAYEILIEPATVIAPAPTRDGYALLGWATSVVAAEIAEQLAEAGQEPSGLILPGQEVTLTDATTTLYAAWREDVEEITQARTVFFVKRNGTWVRLKRMV